MEDRKNVINSQDFETREAGLLMDVDKDILLAQCQRNSVRSVYTFATNYIGQYRGQRSWSAKWLNFLIFNYICNERPRQSHSKPRRWKSMLIHQG